ncbi:HNH endonuclease signature motif containing protein [Marinobacter alkaliphilus]|uniref:Putative HNH nuclease YajD n=2 Tax=Marinobacter TaxID=2742 RepID=A0ABZ3E7Y4_9GAMM|nr:HNH endonuclease signature motif containing protein [Pseudomonadota bacterium]
MANPLCAECSRQGRITAATDVDHIIPHRGDLKLFWSRSNWQSLCHPCHSRKTAREDGGFGNDRG